MAAQQAELHRLGRRGEAAVQRFTGGRTTRHTAPFDLVDRRHGRCYEVKTMRGNGKDLKVHIADSSWARKLEYLLANNLEARLVAVVVGEHGRLEFFEAPLRQHIRVSQMEKVR